MVCACSLLLFSVSVEGNRLTRQMSSAPDHHAPWIVPNNGVHDAEIVCMRTKRACNRLYHLHRCMLIDMCPTSQLVLFRIRWLRFEPPTRSCSWALIRHRCHHQQTTEGWIPLHTVGGHHVLTLLARVTPSMDSLVSTAPAGAALRSRALTDATCGECLRTALMHPSLLYCHSLLLFLLHQLVS